MLIRLADRTTHVAEQRARMTPPGMSPKSTCSPNTVGIGSVFTDVTAKKTLRLLRRLSKQRRLVLVIPWAPNCHPHKMFPTTRNDLRRKTSSLLKTVSRAKNNALKCTGTSVLPVSGPHREQASRVPGPLELLYHCDSPGNKKYSALDNKQVRQNLWGIVLVLPWTSIEGVLRGDTYPRSTKRPFSRRQVH